MTGRQQEGYWTAGPFMARQVAEATTTAGDASQRLLDAAGAVKAELNRLLRRLYDDEGRIRDRRAFDALRYDRERFAVERYLPAIEALRALGRPALVIMSDTLMARLQRGYAMQGLDEDGHRLFGELLCCYEACCDALSDDALAVTMGRLETIATAVP